MLFWCHLAFSRFSGCLTVPFSSFLVDSNLWASVTSLEETMREKGREPLMQMVNSIKQEHGHMTSSAFRHRWRRKRKLKRSEGLQEPRKSQRSMHCGGMMLLNNLETSVPSEVYQCYIFPHNSVLMVLDCTYYTTCLPVALVLPVCFQAQFKMLF